MDAPSVLAVCVCLFSHHALPSQWVPAAAWQLPICPPQTQLTPSCGLAPTDPQLPVLPQLWCSHIPNHSQGGCERRAVGQDNTPRASLASTDPALAGRAVAFCWPRQKSEGLRGMLTLTLAMSVTENCPVCQPQV